MPPINEVALFDALKDEMEKIPTNLFEEVEEELTKLLIAETTEEMGEETDGAFDVIANIVGKIKHQIEK